MSYKLMNKRYPHVCIRVRWYRDEFVLIDSARAHGIIIAIATISHLLPWAVTCRYFIIQGFTVGSGYCRSTWKLSRVPTLTERSAKNYGYNTWPMGIAIRSHIFALSPFQSRASETVKICASRDRKSICELCRVSMTRRFMWTLPDEKKPFASP